MGWKIVKSKLPLRRKQMVFIGSIPFFALNLGYALCSYPEDLCAVYEVVYSFKNFSLLCLIFV